MQVITGCVARGARDYRNYDCLAKDLESLAGLGTLRGDRSGDTAFIQSVWVNPEHRLEGIGRSLVRAFEANVVGDGAVCIKTRSRLDAEGFWQRLGYRSPGPTPPGQAPWYERGDCR